MRIDKFCVPNFKKNIKKINFNSKILSAKENKSNIEISEKYLDTSSSKLQIIIDNLQKCENITKHILNQFKGLTTITPICKDYYFFEEICIEIYIQKKNLHNTFNYVKKIVEKYASIEHLLFDLNIIYKNSISGDENDINNTTRKGVVKIASPPKMYKIPNINVKILVDKSGLVKKDEITFLITIDNNTETKIMKKGESALKINGELTLNFTVDKFLSKNDIILVSYRNRATLGIFTNNCGIKYLNYIIDRLDLYNCLNSILDDGSKLCYPNINIYEYIDEITKFIFKYYKQLFEKNIIHLIESNNYEYWLYLNNKNVLDTSIVPDNFNNFVSDFEIIYTKIKILINIFRKLINIFQAKLDKFHIILKDINNNKVFDSEIFEDFRKINSNCFKKKKKM